MSKISNAASAVGKGLFAGAAGTAAMTVSSTLEAKLRDRGSSSAPAEAAGRVLGVEPCDEAGEARFSNIVHWGYGTSWGAVRGLLGLTSASPAAAGARPFAAVWGGEQVMLPALGVSPPMWKLGAKETAIDAWHHAVYAGATTIAYELLDR